MYLKIIPMMMAMIILSGCVVTKVVTVPMRVGGAAISAVPVVGNITDSAIDTLADAIDVIPI